MYPFGSVCECLENIRKTRDKEAKKNMFGNLLQDYRAKNDTADDVSSIFSILRLLLPEIDKNRGTYGMKEFTIGRIVTSWFKIPVGSIDFKLVNINLHPEVIRNSDYATIIANIVTKYGIPPGTAITVSKLNAYLTEMCAENHSSSVFQTILTETTGLEMKWIVSIILKDVRIGLDPEVILSVFNPQAPLVYKQNNDLLNIIQTVISGDHTGFGIKLLRFLRPMLLVKANVKLLTETNISGFIVEEKYDGERFQFHFNKNDGKYKWFSRTGGTYNDVYSSLTDRIIKAFSENVKNVIFDGEMLGYDAVTGKYGAKGYNYDIKKPKAQRKFQPCFQVFDVMYYNGKSLLDIPLKSRRQMLEQILPSTVTGAIVKSRIAIVNSIQDITEKLNRSIINEWEGIVIKDQKSYYEPGKRSDSWIKVKAEYFSDMLTEFDLIILGGYYGKGNRSGGIATFLMGVSNGKQEYLSVSCSGMGLTNVELKRLQFLLMAHWVKRSKTDNCPDGIHCRTEKPDLWIAPEKSVILEIKASELHYSKSFATTHTLRFPRIVRVRYDKPWYDCMTLDEYNKICAGGGPVVKLFKRMASVADLSIIIPTTPVVEKKLEMTKKSDKLLGKEFLVLEGSVDMSKEMVEKLILENGGTLSNTYSFSTYCIISGQKNFAVQTLINEGTKSVLKLEWLLKALYSSDDLFEWRPFDAYCLSDTATSIVYKNFDEFGDHYTKHATADSIMECVERMIDNFCN